MNYIPVEDLINEVEVNLSNYFQSGSVDSSILYPIVDRCLSTIGVRILPIKETGIIVENFGAPLPEDYYSLILLSVCTQTKTETTPPQGIFTFEQSQCFLPICHSESQYGHNEFGRYQVYQRIEKEIYTHTATKILHLGTDIQGCCNPYIPNKYDAEIKNNRILTQFQNGVLYMQYRSKSTEEILVPDISEIKSWLIAEMEVAIFRHLYLNTQSDVFQRLQFTKSELHILKENARNIYRRNELQDFNNLKKQLQSTFELKSRIHGNNY